MPVLNVSSRVTLDDKALLDSYAVLQEGILCDVFSKALRGMARCPGQRLAVSVMLPGRQWQMNGLTSCFLKGTCAYLHYQGNSQRTAKIAGQAPVDGYQD